MNKTDFMRSRRFRYGSMSVLITALVIAAVILFNVIFSALAAKYLWYVDLTREGIYTLSDQAIDLIDETFKTVEERRENAGETEPVKVTIKFCDLEDNIMESTSSRYVLMTARELADRFPDYVSVEFINIWENPTAVEKYKTSVLSSIYSTDVIVESGTEYRHYSIDKFYLTNSGATSPWAYYGEKRFASGILAVTQAESPVAAILTGHGESFKDAELGYLLELAGYELLVVDDLTTAELPENCRLLVCYNPTSDFLAADGISDISEITILDDFLADNSHSLMVFMSPSSPYLPNLENYLALWGISFGRHADETSGNIYACSVKDTANALTGDGLTFIGEYETVGLGASITADLRTVATPRRVVFKNAMPLYVAKDFDVLHETNSETGESITYGFKDLGGGYSREVYNLFSAADTAVLMADGSQVGTVSSTDSVGLMAISRQFRATQEDNMGLAYADQSSYVFACGSTEFAASTLLLSNTYGNSEVLLRALVEMGKEAVPTSLDIKPFSDTTIDTLTVKRANAYTITLTVIPAAIVFAAGIYVIIRRKYA
ncbi:MAG: Gldg family protein [Clostridia bacterium]|nr:Gldg family protein [Clostridia bacterium]